MVFVGCFLIKGPLMRLVIVWSVVALGISIIIVVMYLTGPFSTSEQETTNSQRTPEEQSPSPGYCIGRASSGSFTVG